MKLIFAMLPLFTLPYSFACMTKGQVSADKQKLFRKSARKPAATLTPFARGHENPSFEAVLANLLLTQKNSKTVLSIPAVIQKSAYHPFGDGQGNAKMGFGQNWKGKEFPVIGIQSVVKGSAVREYRFDPSLNVSGYHETVMDSKWVKVTPNGWKDSFYFNFETGTLPIAQFLNGIPAKLRTFSGNRVAPDLAKIGKGSGVERFQKNLGLGYNREAWYADSVHGQFPDQNGAKTALGGVLTWGIFDKTFGPFKNLYTCFEPRNIQQENAMGVPSGAGWHHIGDAAETLLNDLESVSIPVAIARTHGFSDAAYGLSEGISAVWLASDEALVTQQNDFHWYVNPYQAPVCTEIWVHGCKPSLSNSWGFNCP